MTDEHMTAAGDTPGGAEAPETLADPESAVNTDLTSAVDAEDFDEDRLGVDPLEEGVDPPEGWTAADRQGVTAREQAEGETLDQRLAAERPDTGEAAAEPSPADAGPDPDVRADAGRDTGWPGPLEERTAEIAQAETPDRAVPAGPDDPVLAGAESDHPAPAGTGASTGDPGKAQHQVADDTPAQAAAGAPTSPDGGPAPAGPLPDPDSDPPPEDVPTADESIENREDPGEEYR